MLALNPVAGPMFNPLGLLLFTVAMASRLPRSWDEMLGAAAKGTELEHWTEPPMESW